MSEIRPPADWWGVVWPCLIVVGVLIAWEIGRRVQAKRKNKTRSELRG